MAISTYSTSKMDNAQLGEVVDSMMVAAKDSRRTFERKWYDNNFFDDGHHFRSLRRVDNKIVDLADRSTLWNPMRAIPKASRQLRGMVNLLISQDYVTVIYPEKVYKGAFEDNPQEYQQAMDAAKKTAKTTGHWVEEEFKKQEIKEQKIPHMGILTGKNGISYLKVWPDAIDEAIKTTIRDAFDVYVIGSMTELSDCPFVGEGVPRLIAEIKADERFDPESLQQISPENKYASSEIKDAYMRTRYGGEFNQAEHTATLIQKEFFIEEYLNDENIPRIRRQKGGDEILKRHTDSMGKLKMGDPVFRQVFVAGNIPLKSSYVNLPDYPYVDLRFEPGALYQVPLIERFIPSNKSLDMVVSRVERYTHTMVTGSYSIRQGEQSKPNNSAGGQIFEYTTTPPIQNQIAPIPPFVFNFMNLLNNFMEEQGVSTSTLAQLPAGVKAARAIESLKESEYANLAIATRQLKKTIRRIAEKMLDLADDYFVQPQTTYYLEKGEPQYFDVIGATNLEKRKEMGLTGDLSGEEIPLKRDYRVDIEVQAGLAYTHEGKKAAAKELGDYVLKLGELQMIPPEVVKIFMQAMLETYQFGPTQDIMDAMNEHMGGEYTANQLDALKTAILEVMADLQKGGILPTSEQRVQETKVGVAEVMKDTKMMDKMNPPKQEAAKTPSESISFKDLPPEGKAQMAAQAGIQLNPQQIEADEMEQKQQEQDMAERQLQLKEQQVKKGVPNARKT